MKHTDKTDMNRLNKSAKSASQTDKFLYKDLSYKLLRAIFNVRNNYGSGQKELVYQNALAEELEDLQIPFEREVSILIKSIKSGKTLGKYKLDFVIDNKIIVEIKALKFTPNKIEQQLYAYLRSTTYEVGYLVNFGSTKLFYKRIILTKSASSV